MEFNVICYDFNARKLKKYNVLNESMQELLKKARKQKKFTTRSELKEYLEKEFLYYYWCRSEYEILVGSLWNDDISKFEKIDIYNQLIINLDVITDYVINKMGFRFKDKVK